CLSFVATEVSAVTIIAVPATAFRENWQYLQIFLGSVAARLTITFLFIPAFYKFNCTTIYEFLGIRFGRLTQTTAAIFFFVTRLLGSGVRLMAACLAMSVLIGWPIAPVIGLFILISVVYMALGGIRAVVWTNVIQALVIVAGGVATLGFLAWKIHGGFAEVSGVAGAAGRLSLWNWGPALSDPSWARKFFADPNILWIALLNGLFGSTAAFGTDQDLMQRLLTVETRRESQKTMLLTTLASFGILAIHLAIGTGIYVFYRQHAELPLPQNLETIFPHFIGHVMPAGLRGLLVSSIVLASIDSPLAALATSFVVDLYKPFRERLKRPAADLHYLRASRVSIAAFGVVLALLALWFSSFDKILWLAFKIGGVTFGALLGVFLLGLATRRQANRANLVSMTGSAALMLALLVLSETHRISLGWTWLVVLGTVVAFVGSWLLGPLLDRVLHNGRESCETTTVPFAPKSRESLKRGDDA
ncbi:MAG TPA: hypothetical protein VN783_09425, partial [Thermoanaerobaculia bacterium]|nr:hypothetical protein [Thermoanaerobaculia bacterium]